MSLSERAVGILRRLPPAWRERLKRVVGAAGHGGSRIDGLRARRLAETVKRPEVVLAWASDVLQRTGQPSIAGRDVLDFGSGYLLAEALAFSALGARRVVAVDAVPLLQRQVLRDYAARPDWPGALAAAGIVGADAWLDRLRAALERSDDRWFEALGIDYQAPFNILSATPSTFDLVISLSTLEHVPAALAPAIAARLAALVAPGGAMHHAIHLEDHRDFEKAPFAFLAGDGDYSETEHDLRGNRLRASDWRRHFEACAGFGWTFALLGVREAALPAQLDARWADYERGDLATGHLLVTGRRAVA